MKRKLLVSLIICFTTLLVTACDSDKTTSGKEAVPTEISTTKPPVIDEEKEEPTLSEEAKKLLQFAPLAKGDMIADIVIDGFGTIRIKLFSEQAPLAVENFVTHAKAGYYDGITFHRVIEDFMIQGGDPTGTGSGGESIWKEMFQDELSDELHPYRGALCMANRGENTNSSQFFLVQADAKSVEELIYLLEEGSKTTLKDYIIKNFGVELSNQLIDKYTKYGGTPWLTSYHTVFGQIFEGFDVLDAVAKVAVTNPADNQYKPLEPVIIEKIIITEWK